MVCFNFGEVWIVAKLISNRANLKGNWSGANEVKWHYSLKLTFVSSIRLILCIIIEAFPERKNAWGYFKKIFKSINASEGLWFGGKSLRLPRRFQVFLFFSSITRILFTVIHAFFERETSSGYFKTHNRSTNASEDLHFTEKLAVQDAWTSNCANVKDNCSGANEIRWHHPLTSIFIINYNDSLHYNWSVSWKKTTVAGILRKE